MVDARDLKSLDLTVVPVRFRLRAPRENPAKYYAVKKALRNHKPVDKGVDS